MKIEKVFNNNTVATLSKDKVEMIVTGPGIGLHRFTYRCFFAL